MRSHGYSMIAAAAAMSLVSAGGQPTIEPLPIGDEWQSRYRSKGKPTKRRLKPNRNHISRRVRLKHRKARRAQ